MLCQSILSKLPLNGNFNVDIFSILSFSYLNNKVLLQPACAEEALHFYSIVKQALIACPSLLVMFLTVHAYCVLVDSNEPACRALQPIQRLPKRFYRLRGLIWKLNLSRVDWGEMTEALNDLFSSCSGHAVMLQEMCVKINNSWRMLRTHQNTKLLQKAENVVAVIKRYLQASFAVVLAATCCVCDALRC